MKYYFCMLMETMKIFFLIPIAKAFGKKYKNAWVVTERPNQARDNGYVFFKYMRMQHPEQEVYYVIDKNSKDYEKIKGIGNIIQFNSLSHYIIYIVSRIHISSHVNGCVPNNSLPVFRRIKNRIGYKDVFIPHGVSYGISEFCLKKYAHIDLFICSCEPEYYNVLNNYGYSKSEVAYTGFPRLDYWYDFVVNKNEIVLMPTWRSYLAQNENIVFENTSYFRAYSDLISNKKLHKFLLDSDLKLVFYLHNDMRKYVDFFDTECENIEIVYKDNQYDIQELLKESALLITDYSSVHFDFAYMKKPVIYYQFDKYEFLKKQYQSSVFDAEKDGFGPVAYNVDDLIYMIKKSFENDFIMEKKYYDKMRNFYQLHDQHNCDRVFERIKRL